VNSSENLVQELDGEVRAVFGIVEFNC
jgi:hypothetical protein